MAKTGIDLFDIGANQADADAAYANALAQYQGLEIPTEYTQQGATEYGKITEDPRLRAAQMRALERLQGISEAGGQDAQYRAAQNQAMQEAGQYERGQRQALEGQARQRGTFGGGQQFAAQLMAQQAGAQNAANQGFNNAAQGQQRALQALQGYGSMSGAMRDQDYSQAARKAQAQDQINQFNTQGMNRNRWDTYGAQAQKAQGIAGMQERQGGRYDKKARGGFDDLGGVINTVGRFAGGFMG